MPTGWICFAKFCCEMLRILTFDFQRFCVSGALAEKLMGDLVVLSEGMFHNSDGDN